MEKLILQLTTMANGGMALGRDGQKRPIFVPYAIPGEKVQVQLTEEKQHYARAELLHVLTPSPDRVEARCQHFGTCGGCHLQHMSYEAQLRAKQTIVHDQLQRIGGLGDIKVHPTLPNPTPWAYRHDVSFSPVPGGGLGFWSPKLGQVMPIEVCHIIHPRLLELQKDTDLDLPGLRKLTLRKGDDDDLLAALEIDDVEEPELEADFPLSVAMVLPDETAVILVGDSYIVKTVKGRDFRVSAGCFFQPSLEAAALLVDSVLAYANLSGKEIVLEGYSGVGMLTAFLAQQAAEVVAVEVNPDAVADTAVNLDDLDNITLYEGTVEDTVPTLKTKPTVAVVNPPAAGLTAEALKAVTAQTPKRLVYVSSDVATLARDGKHLTKAGYKLAEIQPIDMTPQAFQIDTVSLWVY